MNKQGGNTFFPLALLSKLEQLLKAGKRIELQYIPNRDELKIGVTNYHKIKLKGETKK